MQSLKILFLSFFLISTKSAFAQGPQVWFAPPDTVSQRALDFLEMFDHPNTWTEAANGVKVLSITANELILGPAPAVSRILEFLRKRHIKLDVSIPGLAVDKRVCGDGVEGVIWKGEMEEYLRRLRAREVNVFSFSFDTPLNSGHLFHGKNACNFSVSETAQLLAASARLIRASYPDAKILDQEVPTGMAVERWRAILTEWLEDYEAAAGEHFFGLTMDVWWEFPWRASVVTTLEILKSHKIRGGIFLDADGHPGMTPLAWVAAAKQNICNVQRENLELQYAVLANWSAPGVKNVPETQSNTLTDLLRWYQSPSACSP